MSTGVNSSDRSNRLAQWGWVVPTVAAFLYAWLPVAWLVVLSVKPAAELTDRSLVPRHWSLQNYQAIADDPQFSSALLNSCGIALIATVCAVVLASGAAYALVRLEFPGKKLILGGALAVAMFPGVAIIGPLFELWRDLGLFDTWMGLILPYMTFTLPLAIWTLTAYFREIPWDLEKAARVDGATAFQAFRLVIMPLAAPGMFTAAILVFIFAWNDFLFAASLTSTDHARTVPVTLAFFTGTSQFEQPTGSIAAASVIMTIPIVLLVLVFQRRIIAGLTSGAVKG